MSKPGIVIYLDQNILSRLRPDEEKRDFYMRIARSMRDKGGIPVFSSAHVAEITQSDRPQAFASILEELDACFLPEPTIQNAGIQLEAGLPQERIGTAPDPIAQAGAALMSSLKLMNSIQGGLGSILPADLLREISDEGAEALRALSTEVPVALRPLFEEQIRRFKQIVEAIPLSSMAQQYTRHRKAFQDRLPNFAQIDEIPAEQAAERLIAYLSPEEQQAIRQNFPKGFLSHPDCEPGDLAGFAFMLFSLGLVRVPHARKGPVHKRHKHYYAQFRDCEHIEHACRCDLILTRDGGAARLARAVYAYAGCATQVWHVEEQ